MQFGLKEEVRLERGHRMKRICGALFLGGFATFSLIYCTQPLLPDFSRDFGRSAASSSMAVSLTTGCLAISLLLAGALSEAVGRRGLMAASIALSAVLNILAAAAPGWGWLLFARAMEGFALGGMPAVAMAYLAEESDPRHLGLAMGLYVSGTAFGGMVGRVAIGALTEVLSWRSALALIGLIDLALAIVFMAMLPQSRNFVIRSGMTLRMHLAAWVGHFRTPFLPSLFITGFLALGGFMAVLNYIGFRLSIAPYDLNSAQVGLIFFVYLGGMAASSAAGALADRVGRGLVMASGALIVLAGLMVTTMTPLPSVVAGTLIITIGFFTVHSIASGWVGRIATRDRGHAASLYLLFYYAGASILGSAGGLAWQSERWNGVGVYVAILFTAILAIALSSFRLNISTCGGRT